MAASAGKSVAEVEALNFHDYEKITDADFSRDFEGTMNHQDYFTPEQWLDAEMFQRFWLSEDFGPQGRDLMLSRMLRKPLKEMQTHVDDILALKEGTKEDSEKSKLKFMVYSAHDDQIDNSMVWLT